MFDMFLSMCSQVKPSHFNYYKAARPHPSDSGFSNSISHFQSVWLIAPGSIHLMLARPANEEVGRVLFDGKGLSLVGTEEAIQEQHPWMDCGSRFRPVYPSLIVYHSLIIRDVDVVQ